MNNKEFKNSIEKIDVSKEVKNDIFNSIMERAKNEELHPESNLKVLPSKKRKQWLPTAVAAVFAVGIFSIFAVNTNMFSDNVTSPIDESDEIKKIYSLEETLSINAYYVNEEEEIKEIFSIEDCPTDPVLAWNYMVELGLYDEEIQLESYNIESSVLYLEFNNALENYLQDSAYDLYYNSIIETFSQFYDDIQVEISIETAE